MKINSKIIPIILLIIILFQVLYVPEVYAFSIPSDEIPGSNITYTQATAIMENKIIEALQAYNTDSQDTLEQLKSKISYSQIREIAEILDTASMFPSYAEVQSNLDQCWEQAWKSERVQKESARVIRGSNPDNIGDVYNGLILGVYTDEHLTKVFTDFIVNKLNEQKGKKLSKEELLALIDIDGIYDIKNIKDRVPYEHADHIEAVMARVNKSFSDAARSQEVYDAIEAILEDDAKVEEVQEGLEKKGEESIAKKEPDRNLILDILLIGVDGLLGILLYPFKILIVLPGFIVQAFATGIAEIGGGTYDGGFITLNQILFNQVYITDINVFSNKTADGKTVNSTILKIRESIANWYYALRNLSIIIALCILIYIGIRMAISSIAEDRAKYKKMLTNWLVGFALIFMLHYIIVVTINANNGLVKALKVGAPGSLEAYTGRLLILSFAPTLSTGYGAAILYALLLCITFAFLIMYIKRMITICFLVIIAPLITVTYSVDKLGDRKIPGIKYMAERIYI